MRTFYAFLRKEGMEQIRSGRLLLLVLIFILFGIMNPAMAKITPWLMQTMSESLESTGLTVGTVEIDALTSWTQYYKNMQMAVIIFVILVSNSLAKEYQSGTLILVVTKGLARFKIMLAKTCMLLLTWTGCYWLCFGITYAYNAYFWDNGIASNLLFTAICYWLFGIWIVALMMFFSAVAKGNTMVLVGTGVIYAGSNLLAMFGKIAAYMPTKLTSGLALLTAETTMDDYYQAIGVTLVISVAAIAAGVLIFNKRMLPAQREG